MMSSDEARPRRSRRLADTWFPDTVMGASEWRHASSLEKTSNQTLTCPAHFAQAVAESRVAMAGTWFAVGEIKARTVRADRARIK